MNKLAIATLAAVASAEQIFLEKAPVENTIPVDIVPIQAEPLSDVVYKNGSKQKIVGYYTSWSIYDRNYQPTDIPYDKVDVVNYAFANILDGKVVMGDSYADSDKAFPGDCWNDGCKRGSFNQLNKAKEANPGLQTMISIGGWTWSGLFSDVAATEASRQIFCESAVEFAVKWGFDGIDIDWEYPVEGGLPDNHHRPEDRDNYSSMIAKLRELLDAQGAKDGKTYRISIASTANYSYLQNYDWKALSESLDWINIMSYDFHGPFGGAMDAVTGHNAALTEDSAEPEAAMAVADFNVQAATELFIKNNIPKSKINVGLAFYGRGYGNVPKGDNQGLFQAYKGSASKGTWEAGSFDFYDLKDNYINKNGYTMSFDAQAGVPWLYSEAAQCMISYDDEASIGLKTQFIQKEQIGGAMFWEFSGDRNADLLNVVYNTLGSTQ